MATHGDFFHGVTDERCELAIPHGGGRPPRQWAVTTDESSPFVYCSATGGTRLVVRSLEPGQLVGGYWMAKF